ncbi:MAG: hypothetical protein CMP22_06490 [Rickettsiales bacterium]|nr:hypothetical protein [Rickettsiales bacterium]
MITLTDSVLSFRFPEVHANAQLDISFLRTLRIPDDGHTYPLPPGLGAFPLEHVDDHMQTAPAKWLEHGGVMLPMYQSEAMWLSFDSLSIPDHYAEYPFAIKIAAGKIDAVSGHTWKDSLDFKDQNYVVSPEQPWLDGFCVEKGQIRQFVAMPLGEGYSVEEQLSSDDLAGGLQIEVFPMKRSAFLKRFPERTMKRFRCATPMLSDMPMASYSLMAPDLGLGAGGTMKQEIEEDPFDPDDWDVETSSRCFIHLCNSDMWKAITGSNPPTKPNTARDYTDHGFPWFDYYSDKPAVSGSKILAAIKSVNQIAKKKGLTIIDNDSVQIENVVKLRSTMKPDQVREGSF